MPSRILGPCSAQGCPNRSDCPIHRSARNREHNQRYGSSYGAEHAALRAGYQRRMDAGEAFNCWRCSRLINPQSWDLGHLDDRQGYAGPECVSCNRAVSGRRPGKA